MKSPKDYCTMCCELINNGRAQLGYSTCLDCREAMANELAEKRKKQVAPAYNKGAYQYITINDIKTIGR